jgi:hypothetical protein
MQHSRLKGTLVTEIDQPKGAPEKSGISRRTVTKAMAWAVPVIAVAAPAPAFAASGPPPTICPGVGCKLPGASCDGAVPGLDGTKGFIFPIRITNNDCCKSIVLLAITIDPFAGKTFTVINALPSGSLAPGASVDYSVYANGSNSTTNGGSSVMHITWGHDATDTDHEVIDVPFTIDPFGVCKQGVRRTLDGGVQWFGPNVCTNPPFLQIPGSECV